MKYLILALFVVGACNADEGFETASAALTDDCPPVRTSEPVVAGDVLTSDLDAFFVENGLVRLRYGARGQDFRDLGVVSWDGLTASGTPVALNMEQPFAHFLEARHEDAPQVAGDATCAGAACHDGSGTHWHDVNYSWYGDGAKYSSSSMTRHADRVRVLRADADAVELAYEWDDVAFDGYHYEGYCYLGYWPDCGPVALDHTGEPIYYHGTDIVRSVSHAKVWKTVRMERCSSGYFVSMRSDPPLVWYNQGERGVRTGYVTSAVSWTCDGQHVAHHPSAGDHVFFGEGNCIADIPQEQVGHNGWPFVRVLVLNDPTPLASLQYTPDQLGSPGPAFTITDHVGDDGRPVAWQAFIGATEYVSPDLVAEPTTTALGLVTSLIPQEWPR